MSIKTVSRTAGLVLAGLLTQEDDHPDAGGAVVLDGGPGLGVLARGQDEGLGQGTRWPCRAK